VHLFVHCPFLIAVTVIDLYSAQHAFCSCFLSSIMALRRLAQENNASNASPRSPEGLSQHPTTPRSGYTPTTPRTQDRQPYGLYRSPADTPSISSSVPFDWDAARSRGPAPYATPIKSRSRKSVSTGTTTTSRKAVVRKKGFFEK